MSTRPFTPSYIKSVFNDSRPVEARYADFDVSTSNHSSTGSFKYDPLGHPLKSTQQLNVDWSSFENHVFFSSAEVRVNETFGRIINGYPFDGSKREVEAFIDDLTGFEKWVFDQFPEWAGVLLFSGTVVGEDPSGGYSSGLGTWISVTDKIGASHPGITRRDTGESIMNPPASASLSIEFLLKLPEMINTDQVIAQKVTSSYDGFTLYVSSSASTTSASIVFSVTSGSARSWAGATIEKGRFTHLCAVVDKEALSGTVRVYVDEELAGVSRNYVSFGKLPVDDIPLTIGSGSRFTVDGVAVTPTCTLSGTMDEFRLFHEARSIRAQKLYASRGLDSLPTLKLYYRFNEPTGSSDVSAYSSMVLDSSGNSLHSVVSNHTSSLRRDMSADDENVMVNESHRHKIVLFPYYSGVTDLNSELLTDARAYDLTNPNNILRLVPQHYLREGASQDGFETVEGNGGDVVEGNGAPGSAKVGSVQIILTFLYIWAKFFDEVKLFVESFGNIRTVDYDEYDTIPDNFLNDYVRQSGFHLPTFFNHASTEQFVDGVNVAGLIDSSVPLKTIQAAMMRRVLTNMPDIIRSKGTRHSIKAFLRSIGIDPENSLKIREYGGPTVKQLDSSRERRMDVIGMVTLATSSLITTPFLSSSRVEPGWPEPVGSFVYGVDGRSGTTSPNDGLLTSGSWTLEGLFKIPPQALEDINDTDGNQSLMRVLVTGSSTGVDPGLICNVIATQMTRYPKVSSQVRAYLRTSVTGSSPVLVMSVDVSGSGLFDGDAWNVSFGRHRSDDQAIPTMSSSYFLRVGKLESGDLTETYVTSSYFRESTSSDDVLQIVTGSHNASGSFVCIGRQQTLNYGVGRPFLNDSVNVDSEARTVDYVGWVGGLRFWSKGTTEREWRERVRNPRSLGVFDPGVNYNFTSNVSGSFGKLRLDTLNKQSSRTTDATGSIVFRDLSLNGRDTTGTGLSYDTRVIIGHPMEYTHISPSFDESSTDDKVRIRSFIDPSLAADDPWAVQAPTYLSAPTLASEEPLDDPRLSIEFSMIDSLDRDMVNMFSDLGAMGDALGRPELAFSVDYPDLDRLRDVYFNRLSGRPDFKRFLDFYKWFDVSITSFIEQLVSSRTHYKGTNYVIESHMLERHKRLYNHHENYTGSRRQVFDGIKVMQVVGRLRKY